MNWTVKHHTAVLLWLAGASMLAASTIGNSVHIIMKAAAFIVIAAGVKEVKYDYDD